MHAGRRSGWLPTTLFVHPGEGGGRLWSWRRPVSSSSPARDPRPRLPVIAVNAPSRARRSPRMLRHSHVLVRAYTHNNNNIMMPGFQSTKERSIKAAPRGSETHGVFNLGRAGRHGGHHAPAPALEAALYAAAARAAARRTSTSTRAPAGLQCHWSSLP